MAEVLLYFYTSCEVKICGGGGGGEMWPFRWRQVKFSGVASQKSQLVKESGSGNMVQTANNGEKVVHNNDLNNVHCSQLHFESLSLKKPHQNS